MPIHPKLPNSSDSVSRSLRLSFGTSVTSRVLMMKYANAKRMVADSSTGAMFQPRVRTAASVASSSVPAQNIATAAIAGLTMRLVQRLDVRHDPTSASPVEASVAAAGPYSSSRLKMKISPAANEFFERGTRTGNTPASIATATPIATGRWRDAGSTATESTEAAIVTAPSATMDHQYSAALRL